MRKRVLWKEGGQGFAMTAAKNGRIGGMTLKRTRPAVVAGICAALENSSKRFAQCRSMNGDLDSFALQVEAFADFCSADSAIRLLGLDFESEMKLRYELDEWMEQNGLRPCTCTAHDWKTVRMVVAEAASEWPRGA